MRTTLILDDDVAALLEHLRESRKISLKEAVNEALRLGLKQMMATPRPREQYRTPSVSLRKCLLGRIDDVAEALAIAEGEAYR